MYIKIYVFKVVEFNSAIEIPFWGQREAGGGGEFENLSEI